jgi:Cft2 family RNA processing exonuclease
MAIPYPVQYRRGVHLPEVGLWLDPRERRDLAVVSHAHGDHIARHEEVVCTEPTYRILVHRTARRRKVTQGRLLAYAESAEVGAAEVSLHPAGHVLGSAQVLVRHRGVRVLYSGDIRLRGGRTAEPLEHVEADVLIVESTFGRPQYRFPDPATVVAAICDFCVAVVAAGGVPVLLGYSLGKGQELLACLSEAGMPIVLHPSLHAVTEIYRGLGVSLPPARCWNGSANVPAGSVLIWPPHLRSVASVRGLAGARVACVTGWAVERDYALHMGVDAAFALSDHADFDELCTYVERSGARLVYTVFGKAEDFAHQLRRRGLEAHALAADQQLTLALA